MRQLSRRDAEPVGHLQRWRPGGVTVRNHTAESPSSWWHVHLDREDFAIEASEADAEHHQAAGDRGRNQGLFLGAAVLILLGGGLLIMARARRRG